METVKIFVSHGSRYAALAKSLKLSLQALEDTTRLDIRISEEMVGATDWRQWIEDNVRSADMFLLLYPHVGMDMGWCNYELGRFYDSTRKIACIKNVDIPKPPPAFQPYQAYTADKDGLRKFINELFVLGTFSGGVPVNRAVGQVANSLYARANDVAVELAQEFAQARVREQQYERRIEISIRYKGNQEFDPDASFVEGNAEGLNMLGLDATGHRPWSTVRQALIKRADWPIELEKSFPIPEGALPPALSPFVASNRVFVPVIARAESRDGLVRTVVLLLVEAETNRLRSLLDWSLPVTMPASIAFLVQLFRMMFRARWEILEPRYQEARYRAPSPERCSELARAVLADYTQMQRDAETQGLSGLDKFYSAFHKDLRPELEKYGQEWMDLTDHLRTAIDKPEELNGQLKALLANNAKWLSVSARQLELTIADQL